MFSFATDDIPLAYAFTDDGINTIFLVTDGNEYYREYIVPGIPIANVPDSLYASDSRKFYAAKLGTVNAYAHNSETTESEWTSYTLPGPPTMIKGVASGIVLTEMWDDCIYTFADGTLQSAGISLLSSVYPPAAVTSVKSTGQVYVYGRSGGTGGLFNTNNPSVSLGFLNTGGPGTTIVYLSGTGGDIYLGSKDFLYSLAEGVLNSVSLGGTAQSYAIIDSKNIYAAAASATLDLMKLEGNSFVLKKYITSPGGTMIIIPFGENYLMVGISGATPTSENGLYKYDITANTFSKISPRPVYSLDRSKIN